MDEIKKLLRKINKKDRILIEQALHKLYKGKLEQLSMKKLKGYDHIFRIRVGNYRIIYYHEGNEIILKAIRKRNESTYNDF